MNPFHHYYSQRFAPIFGPATECNKLVINRTQKKAFKSNTHQTYVNAACQAHKYYALL